MNKFIHNDRGESVVLKEGVRLESGIKPDLGFPYDILHYDDAVQVKSYQGVESDLTSDEMAAIENFITNVVEDPQAKLNSQALEFLGWTDWYAVRAAETGVAVPADIISKRAAARAVISDMNAVYEWPPTS